MDDSPSDTSSLSWLPIVLQCHADIENNERNEIVLRLMQHVREQQLSVPNSNADDSLIPILARRSVAGSTAYVLQYPGKLAALATIRPALGDYQSSVVLDDAVELLKTILAESRRNIDLFQSVLFVDSLNAAQLEWSRQCYAQAGLKKLAILGQFEWINHRTEEYCAFSPVPPINRQIEFTRNTSGTDIPLNLIPWTDDLTPALCSVVERTYEASLDVPQLNGIRSTKDTLTGYLSASPGSEPFWWLIQHREESRENEFCAVMLIAQHNATTAELVYFGVCPEYRGKGIGRMLVKKMQQQSMEMGIERILLAVDDQNSFASRLYREAGFQRIGTAEVWFRPSANPSEDARAL